MREVRVGSALGRGGILAATGLAIVLLSGVSAGPGGASMAQGPPQAWEMLLFGGPGNQLGLSVTAHPGQVIVGMQDDSTFGGSLRSFAIPGLTPQWTLNQWGQWNAVLATTPSALYGSGSAYPPACGASDGVGDTEGKVMLARYTFAGVPLGCGSYNFFPYRGGESYQAVAVSNEGGDDYVYAGGSGEQMGFGWSGPFLLAKYDAAGTMLNKVTEPDIGWGWPPYWPVGYSFVFGLVAVDGYLYAAGDSKLPYAGEDSGNWGGPWGGNQRPVLMKYDFDLNRVWKRRADIAAPYPGYSGRFRAVTALGGYIYAGGGGMPPSGGPGDLDYLVEKFDQDGNRIWSASWGGPYEDMIRGLVAVGDRLFAVGYRYETPHVDYFDGESDAVLFEINPNDGSILLSVEFGGDHVDRANGVATDGQDLYIVGETRSYASDEGNAVGQNEGMLIHYRLNRAPEADAGPDQTVECTSAGCAMVTLSGAASTDPDGDALTYAWVGPFGTADVVNPTVQLPLGEHTIALTVADTSGATSTDTVVVTVVDTTGPSIGALSASPAVLWPPDHRMVPISLAVPVTDACDPVPVARIVSVVSNEPVNGLGDGDTAPDWEVAGELTLKLRAERSGTGGGRVYTITVRAVDSAGNASEPKAVTVLVPKSQKIK